jgi:hypothetical protein
MRGNAQQCFREHFNIEHSANRLLAVIDSTASKSAR